MTRKRLQWGLLAALVAGLAGTWLAGALILGEANPPGRYAGTIVSPESDRLLDRACHDCHSHRTRWPWYSHVPPVSLFVAIDVAEGREHLNFDRWADLSPEQRVEHLRESLEEMREGEMPPGYYVALHPEAEVTVSDRARLAADALDRYGPAVLEEEEAEGE